MATDLEVRPMQEAHVDGVAVEVTMELAWLLRREGMPVEVGSLSDAQERALRACYERLEAGLRALPIAPAPRGWRDRVLASIESDRRRS
jgi:hypothetical protein